MAFGPVQLPDYSKNSLFDLASVDQSINQTQGGRNLVQAGQQDLQDRSTLRGLAGGLANRDPDALATAATLPGGTGVVTALSEADKSAAASRLAMATFARTGISFPGLTGNPGAPGASTGGGPATPGNDNSSDPDAAYAPGGAVSIPPSLLPIYQQAAHDNNIPVEVLAARDFHESGFDPTRVGTSGEIGVSQILPSTAANPGYGMAPISAADSADPTKAIPWSAAYMAAKAKASGVTDWNNVGAVRLGLAAYNGAGPQAQTYANTVLGNVPVSGREPPVGR